MSSKTTQNVNSVVATIISISLNIIVIAVVVMCVYTFATKAYEFGNAIFDSTPVDQYNGRDVVVSIPKDASAAEIADLMYKAGVVKDKYVFMVQLLLSDYKKKVVSGTYTFSTSMLPNELINAMAPVVTEEGPQP